MWDELLHTLAPGKNLRYEDLTQEERETFNVMAKSLQNSQLTVEKLKEYYASIRYSIESTLAKCDLEKDKDKVNRLLGRLENMMLLEAFLHSPERAKSMLQQALQGFQGKK